MSKHLYSIEDVYNGIKIRIDAKTAVYLRNLPKAKPVCWDNNGKEFDITIQKYFDSYIIIPQGDIEYPAYIDVCVEEDNSILYIA